MLESDYVLGNFEKHYIEKLYVFGDTLFTLEFAEIAIGISSLYNAKLSSLNFDATNFDTNVPQISNNSKIETIVKKLEEARLIEKHELFYKLTKKTTSILDTIERQERDKLDQYKKTYLQNVLDWLEKSQQNTIKISNNIYCIESVLDMASDCSDFNTYTYVAGCLCQTNGYYHINKLEDRRSIVLNQAIHYLELSKENSLKNWIYFIYAVFLQEKDLFSDSILYLDKIINNF